MDSLLFVYYVSYNKKINAKRTRYNRRHNAEIYYASSISSEILIVSSVKTTLYLGISELDLSLIQSGIYKNKAKKNNSGSQL